MNLEDFLTLGTLYCLISATRGNIVRIDSATDDTIRVSLGVAIRFTDASVNRYTPSGIPDMLWSCYVIMVVADVLVPNRHQAISNHHADSTVTIVSYITIQMWHYQGWRVLDGTWFLPWYLPVNTILGKTGFGHPKWEKLGKTQLHFKNNFICQ